MTTSAPMARRLRVAVVCDARDEGWRSMDLVADMLAGHLEREHAGEVEVTALCPPMRTRARRYAGPERWAAFTADRALHRFWDYPRFLAARRDTFDIFHVVDHSYAQVVHALPERRTIVTCHDIDAFRSVLEPRDHHRSLAFRLMTRRILSGLRRSARVICHSEATRGDLLRHGVVGETRALVIPAGVHPALRPERDAAADAEASRLLGPPTDARVELLHVGSTVPRKRIEVLLRVFAAVRRDHPATRLVRVGVGFTAQQRALAHALGITDAIVELPLLTPAVLGAVYRRAALVLQPSEREGFCLPVVEALACATPVIASDLPVLREVGREAVTYRPVGDIAAWSASVAEHLRERVEDPARWRRRREAAVARAARFSWSAYTRRTVEVYRDVLRAATTVADPAPVT